METDEEWVTEFAHQVRAARKYRGWTQQETADAIGVHLRTVQSVESGAHVPHPANVAALKRVFGLDASASETRHSWSRAAQVIADVVGQAVNALHPNDQDQFVLELTRFVFDRQVEYRTRGAETARPVTD